MYELTCPECRHVMKTPFARVGAKAACPQCKRNFSVSTDSLRRLGPPPWVPEPLTLGAGEAAATREPVADPPPLPTVPPPPTRVADRPAKPRPVIENIDHQPELIEDTPAHPRPAAGRQAS